MSNSRRGRRARSRALAALTAGLLSAGLITSVTSAPVSATGDPCGPSGNPISCENSKPGSPASEWDIEGAGDPDIQGFATDISVDVGHQVDFKIDTTARSYSITIYRTGYYGGDGARKITTVTPSATLPQHQPSCITDVSTQLYDCGTWGVSASWDVPSTAVSGVYIARLRRSDTGGESHITFVVRNDASTSAVVAQTSDPTWHAYNMYGGSNFYRGGNNGRAYQLSYNRPFATRDGTEARDFYFASEYPLVRFMEKNGYDVSYIAGVDSDRNGELLTNHRTFVSMGHDEYWSGAQRANVEAARDAGVNLMFLSGNEAYWRTRYEPSADPEHTPGRILTSYKETWSNDKIDPSPEWTGTWRDPRFASKLSGAGRPENGLTGTLYMSNDTDLPVTVSADEAKLRLWRGTSLRSLAAGASAQLAPHTVGYESNEDLDNGARPPGLIRLSTTTGPAPQYLQDFGNDVAEGTTTHHLTMYRAASGALVFSAGSIQWTWGLDATHDGNGAPADRRMQQAQVNLFADMGAQPTTLDPTLTAATKSTDTTAPTTEITSPDGSTSVANGTFFTATGTATDTDGVVAGVEVSTDGGTTWHPATGTTSWSYRYVQSGTGATPVMARAVDDSANIGSPVTQSLTVGCPCSVFGDEVPNVPAADDATNLELGLRFSPTTDGYVSGVRFYKGAGNTGTHVGSLWSSAGQKLAAVTFSGESSTGWQEATFASAVPVTKDETYTVSYTAPNGHYAVKPHAFSAMGVKAHPLSVDGGYGAVRAGVHGAPGRMPDSAFRNSNYYVDALFVLTDSSPLTVTSHWPLSGSTSVPLGSTVSATFSKPLAPGSATMTLTDANGSLVDGSTAYDAGSRTVTFTPSSELSGFVKYTARAGGVDTQGNAVSSGARSSFTTVKPAPPRGVCPCSTMTDSTTPTILQAADPSAVSLGVRFSADVPGTITGVKFYKGPNNTGSHTGALWTASGTQLAEGTFTDESTSGWQTLTFDEPVEIAKNTEYVASYRAPAGMYSATPGDLAAERITAPLRTSANGGSYTYGSGFPATRTSTSYLVDVVFERLAPQIAITAQDPPAGAVDVPRDTDIGVWFDDAIKPGATLDVTSGGSPVTGTSRLSADATRLTFDPAGLLPQDATVTVTLTDVTSTSGASLGTRTWTFHTSTGDSTGEPQTLFSDQVPQVPSVNDGSAVEVGTAFRPAKDGTITSIRFYKGPGNAGTHVGRLWSETGQQLASVTFTNETPTGWQTARLPQPVSVTAGTSYVVSYLAPQGHYASTGGFFANALTNGDLTAPAGKNGRYLYGSSGGLPIYDFNATSYFVDVAFVADPPTLTVRDVSPDSGDTDVQLASTVSATLSAPVAPGYSLTVTNGTSEVAGTTSLSSDKETITFTPSARLPADTELTARLRDVVSTEGASVADRTWTFRTEASGTTAHSLFAGSTPSVASLNDSSPVELGTAFSSSVDGTVTAIRFYKGPGNGGTHVGSLWSASGERLAMVTFTGEGASGWQTATLSTPVPITGGTTYVVSYYAPEGHYSVTPGFFAVPWTVGPLSARTSNNGVFAYGEGGGFPTGSYNATNYFVDVIVRAASS
ncbi:DUF4082 domain-containing protein [Aeromicrobium chenweiae]|uniref:Uncharacterized protein n=1 Tax=Aeromicrobium chenweiae TaxID=2079793 RepID=A0A2S0WJM7_9ACTN|nr:DUF4082 domain-containing protein [Aeromicrobium chenweiae]AWB91440.1 hypothetical protein C3E78_03950 [Aeromicrobium chenweiae]TGN30629.1 DUF4082 domain-containing protein [Aeromicrobium chenweiae]